ncbi:MAG: hypothetical protein ACRDYF_06500, partial [Acidimicrobiia bacterium]
MGSNRHPAIPEPARMRLSWSALAICVATVLVLVLPSPAVPVLVVGCALGATATRRRSIGARAIWEAVEPASLVGVFGVTVALGVLARSWSGPTRLMADAGSAQSALVGVIAAVAVNNLPASVLLASHLPPHPGALLLGLNLGPNLAVTGSLSALIWFRVARAVGANPS